VLVATLDFEILDPALQLAADGGAGRQPEDVARAHVLDQVEELEIAPDTAMVAATGDIYYGLWYPIVVSIMTLVIGALFLSETRHRDIRTYDHSMLP